MIFRLRVGLSLSLDNLLVIQNLNCFMIFAMSKYLMNSLLGSSALAAERWEEVHFYCLRIWWKMWVYIASD